MIIGVLKEPNFETRVSILAESVAALIKTDVDTDNDILQKIDEKN